MNNFVFSFQTLKTKALMMLDERVRRQNDDKSNTKGICTKKNNYCGRDPFFTRTVQGSDIETFTLHFEALIQEVTVAFRSPPVGTSKVTNSDPLIFANAMPFSLILLSISEEFNFSLYCPATPPHRTRSTKVQTVERIISPENLQLQKRNKRTVLIIVKMKLSVYFRQQKKIHDIHLSERLTYLKIHLKAVRWILFAQYDLIPQDSNNKLAEILYHFYDRKREFFF